MRNVYKLLASQYDPLGYLAPFTARAKILVQDLWKQEREWDNIIKSDSLLEKWQAWELELQNLPDIHFPRCYLPLSTNTATSESHMHVFCDASERVYGTVAYLQIKNEHDSNHVAFIMARSRIAPKRQLSIPRLELCAALSGDQLANLLSSELTFHRWSQGPPFLLLNSNCWPANPCMPHESEPVEELRKTMFCGTGMSDIINLPDPKKYSNWNDLIKETKNTLYGAADHNSSAAQCYISSERHLLQRAQSECFPEEFNALKADKAIPKSSKLLPLSPEYDSDTGLIRVGGRLRRVETLDYENIHPIVLDPRHPLTKLIIKHYDEKLRLRACLGGNEMQVLDSAWSPSHTPASTPVSRLSKMENQSSHSQNGRPSSSPP